MNALVLDKCFLQSATWQRVCALAEEYELVITGSLFYELLSGDVTARARVFSKLPRKDNPAHLLNNLTSLLKHEDQTHTPAGNILEHALKINYKFNPKLVDQDYELPEIAQQGLRELEATTRRLVDSYIARTNAVAEMFVRVTVGSDESRLLALAEIEEEISDPENVIAFYRSIEDPKLPPVDLLTQDWATFRFYQVSLLFSLHTIHRLRGPIPATPLTKELERLEHDVHDTVVLCTALLAGGLATNEKKLKRWWGLLSPNGVLICT